MIYLLLIDDEEDIRKFVVLYEKYRYLMMKVAFDILGNYHDAEDAVQEAFLRLVFNMEHIGNPTDNKTKNYLVIITKNIAIDILRKRNIKTGREINLDDIDICKVPVTYIEDNIDYEIVETLRCLPRKYRDIFLLKYAGGYDNKTIAEIMGISERTVRNRLAKGKAILQEKLNG